MDSQMMIDVISRIIHVSTAIALLGGSTFMLFVLHPAANQLSESEHEKLRKIIVGRWKMFVHIGIVLFIVSGLYNFVQALPGHRKDVVYHALIGIKILMALGIFFIASVLVGRSAKFESMRKDRAKWLTVVVLLGFAIVAISGFAKVRGPTTGVKPAETIRPIENVSR